MYLSLGRTVVEQIYEKKAGKSFDFFWQDYLGQTANLNLKFLEIFIKLKIYFNCPMKKKIPQKENTQTNRAMKM